MIVCIFSPFFEKTGGEETFGTMQSVIFHRSPKRLCQIKRWHIRLFATMKDFCRRSMPPKTCGHKKMYRLLLWGAPSVASGGTLLPPCLLPLAPLPSGATSHAFSIATAARPRTNALTLDPPGSGHDSAASYSVASLCPLPFPLSHCGICLPFPSRWGSCALRLRSPHHA